MLNRIETEVDFCFFFLRWHHKIDATDTCTYVKQVSCFDPSLPPSHLFVSLSA